MCIAQHTSTRLLVGHLHLVHTAFVLFPLLSCRAPYVCVLLLQSSSVFPYPRALPEILPIPSRQAGGDKKIAPCWTVVSRLVV